MTEPRPNKMTPGIALNAGRKVAAELLSADLVQGKLDEIAQDIARCGNRYDDGYKLAKELERRCGWDCDLQIAEELDGFSSYVRSGIEAAEKAWAERNAITRPFPDGTRVRLRRGETGVITGVYECGGARFLVAIDGDDAAAPPTNSRRIINFEDATEIEREPAKV